MPIAEIDIYNMAFDLLDEEVAIDPSDDRAPVRWMKRNYGPVRDAVLRRHPWNFAITRVALPALSEDPAFGWDYQYQLPNDCLRLLPLTYQGGFNTNPIKHAVEGRRILTDARPPLNVRYVRRVEDTREFDPLFTQLFAAELAVRGANWITGKQSYAERLGQMVRELNEQATLLDALEGTPADPIDDDLIAVRFS